MSGKDGGLKGVENAMRHIPSEMQVFSMIPMTKAGLYTGNVLVSGWSGTENSTYVVELGDRSDQLNQGYLITSDFIEKRLPDLLSNVQDVQPEMSEVYIEVLPENKKPLEPQVQEKVITDLGQSPGSYIPNTLFPEQREGKVLKEQPKSTPPKKVIRTLETPKMLKEEEMIGQRLPKHVLPQYILTLNQPFKYMLLRDTTEAFHSFRWQVPPPKGMFFHYESRAIQWVPDDTQLGAYKLGYRIEMKTGESVSLEATIKDSLLTYQMIPELEGYDEYVWVLSLIHI